MASRINRAIELLALVGGEGTRDQQSGSRRVCKRSSPKGPGLLGIRPSQLVSCGSVICSGLRVVDERRPRSSRKRASGW